MQSRGITLLELLIYIAVMGIITAIAIPSFSNLIKNSKISTSLTNLTADLYLARSAAIRHNSYAVICPRNSSDNDCSESPSWEKGWIVFIDNNKDGICNFNAGQCADKGKIIKIGEGVKSSDLKMRGYKHRSFRIRYDPMGFSYAYNGKVIACDDRGKDYARAIIISNSGRIRTSEKNDKLKCE
ncbi:MAG: hypothetical protein D6B28_08690 [Gammaproteobacteria bacterium]|mgnify:CR=1 FL=1|nr:MAG: hypothetical protein D6B28_08690 [Gammaproteobacteria bacterium]